MKIKKLILKILSFTLMIGFILQVTSLATMTDKAKSLKLSYFRYAQGEYKDGYALNTIDSNHFPIYQIMDQNATNFYCLNANVGEAWYTGTISTQSQYNRSYDLTTDIDQLKRDTKAVYSSIGESSYLKQILWILDNIYIPDTSATATESSNLAKKQELLAKAGIVYGKKIITGINGENIETNDIGHQLLQQRRIAKLAKAFALVPV